MIEKQKCIFRLEFIYFFIRCITLSFPNGIKTRNVKEDVFNELSRHRLCLCFLLSPQLIMQCK